MWLWVLSIFLVIIPATKQYENGRVVCYYRADNVYRSEGYRMQPQEIDPQLCTHIIYYSAFLHPEEAIESSDPFIDLTRGGYKRIVKLKEKNPDLKVMLSIRSDPQGKDLWPLIAAEKHVRHWFSLLVIKFLRAHNFDGLDIIWQIPSHKMTPHKYLYLLKDMRNHIEAESQKYGLPKLELSVFLPAQIQQLHRHFQLANASKYVDFINVATMDYWILDPYIVQHHAPLFMNATEGSISPINVDESIKYYLFKCVPPEKIVLGIPTYGRSFKLRNRNRYNIGSSCSYPGEKGFATNMPGTLAYFEICTYINEDDWYLGNLHLGSMGPYAYFDEKWVGFDDVRMVSKKAKYARDQQLGGLMFWTIDQDDFRGYCQQRFPLIRAGKFTITTGIEVRDQDELEDEEEKWFMIEQGYQYPSPTIKQPEPTWHEISTTPMNHISPTNIPVSMKPSQSTTKADDIALNNHDLTSSSEPTITTQKPTHKPSTPTTTSKPSTSIKPDISQKPTISNKPSSPKPLTSPVLPMNTESKDLLSSSATSSTTTFSPQTSSATPSPNFPTFPSQSYSEDDENNNAAVNAINQLNKVLDTVNQVVENINEVNNANQAQNTKRTNTTIDPSFLQILQPLFNFRNRAQYTVDMSQPGRPANSSVTFDSDVNRFSMMNNSSTKKLIGIPLSQLLPLVNNSRIPLNITDPRNSMPFDMLAEKNLIISGRDIVTINVNITINNNYYGNN